MATITPNQPNGQGKEDRTFKAWLRNSDTLQFIAIFAVATTILIAMLVNLKSVVQSVKESWYEGIFEGIMATMGVCLPPFLIILVGYKGFYQWWHDYRDNKTR